LRPGCLEGPYSEVATISVVAADLEASRRFYVDFLGLRAVVDAETGAESRAGANALTGVPTDTRIHFSVYAEPGEASGKILLVHFFERTGKRLTGRMRPGHLGFSMMTHWVDDLASLHAEALRQSVTVLREPVTIEYGGAQQRMLMLEGPNGECFEFLEGGHR
jgi:catechol 2,3-dioxygenase-like lactoylglutathione lyase family enzyme